ncbi:hypothetical protein FAES_2459 [Fibrella aestuarina BUZ 2]|uniref:Uncharacterized protein n=1 Tax=Fibrella aestuarina BUZ 2 TaxID=1166018 RepID=I0K8L5_9BACT|nr:hypothetical protein [Fibrella aestuarina]CCH00468.1 hypothetical protein FAES_2459 [Fibrella aestuarina BUZ 2]
MQPQTDKPGQPERASDESTAPDSETQSSASSAQGARNNPELNEEKTGSRENEPAEG